jgi:type I restriction enzyme S subunit
MPETTQVTAVLGECLDSVVDYRGKTPPKSPFGIPTITAANVKSGRIDMSTVSYVSEKTYLKWTTRGFPEAGDVLITTEAPVGEVAPFPGDQTYLITRRVFAMRGKKGLLDNTYLLYACLSSTVQDELQSRIRGSTVPRVLKTDILGLQIPLPPIHEQKAIAHVLGTLDEKIELNRKTNETLEAMAKALFKSWFVDFDPVRAKAEGSPTGLPAGMSDLFPDSFEDSVLGEIPSGWTAGNLANLAALNPESWSASNHPKSVVYIDLSGTKNGRIEEATAYKWFDAPSRARRVLREGDTIVGTVRPGNRSFSLIQEPGLTGSTGFAVARPRQQFNSTMIYLAATSEQSIERLAHLADGGAYPAVRPDVIMETPLVIPPELIQIAFSNFAIPIYKRIATIVNKSKLLRELRDTLLPKLISGELRIPDAEQLVEAAGL